MTCERCKASSRDKPPCKRFVMVDGLDPERRVVYCERCAKEAKKPKPKSEAA